MSAQDYPITFGYGATDGVYYGAAAQGKPTYIGPYHRGDDRAMPYGTSVIVNGVQIGLSGNGNGRYGAHLHVGKFVNGSDVNPEGQGFNLNGAKVIMVVPQYATDPVNAQYVRIQDASGAQWVYLHMSQVNVSVGQVLQGASPEGEELMNRAVVFNCFFNLEDRTPTEADYAAWVGQPLEKYLNERGFAAVNDKKLNDGDVQNFYYHLDQPVPDAEAVKFWTGHFPKDLFYAIINSEAYKDQHK